MVTFRFEWGCSERRAEVRRSREQEEMENVEKILVDKFMEPFPAPGEAS